MDDEWYVARDGQSFGPYSLPKLRQHIAAGHVAAVDLLCRRGDTAWVPARDVAGVADLLVSAAPAALPPDLPPLPVVPARPPGRELAMSTAGQPPREPTERILFEHRFKQIGVQVTTARATFGATMYPIAGITAVTVAKNAGLTTLVGSCGLVLGLVLCRSMSGDGAGCVVAMGLVLAALGVAVIVHGRVRPTYHLLLQTAGMQQRALATTEADAATRLAAALREAIVACPR